MTTNQVVDHLHVYIQISKFLKPQTTPAIDEVFVKNRLKTDYGSISMITFDEDFDADLNPITVKDMLDNEIQLLKKQSTTDIHYIKYAVAVDGSWFEPLDDTKNINYYDNIRKDVEELMAIIINCEWGLIQHCKTFCSFLLKFFSKDEKSESNTSSLTNITNQIQLLVNELKQKAEEANRKPYYYDKTSNIWGFTDEFEAQHPDIEFWNVEGADSWRVLEMVLAIMKTHPKIPQAKAILLARSFVDICDTAL